MMMKILLICYDERLVLFLFGQNGHCLHSDAFINHVGSPAIGEHFGGEFNDTEKVLELDLNGTNSFLKELHRFATREIVTKVKNVAIYKGKYDELNSESCKRKVIEISRANCEILKQLNDQKFSIYESLNLLKAAFNWGENEEAKIIFLNNVHHELAINFEYNQRKDIYDRVEDLLSDWVDDWTLPYHEILQLSKESYLKKNAEFMLKGFAWRAFAFSFHSSTENQFWPGESWVLFFVLLVGSVDRAAPQAPGRHTAAAREPVETERLVFTQIMGENHASLKESTPIARRQLSFI
uniref:HAT C-terminal dimerisation domain-containing protein n=1 Tax=Globodera rostochiensis TaxID=31243 RepID=A0A914H6T4_GLORO